MAGRDLGNIPARDRGFGIVFQSYSLFPNMTVAQNVGYGLKIRKAPQDKIASRVTELLALVKLSALADRYPWQLSGGQQQRVALARAIAVDPALILLDEPLSALDARVRADLRTEIRDVQRRLGIPTIMVTHDQEEAMMLADRIVCMNQGRIEQIGTPQDLYLRPATRFVADFMGHSNLLPTDWVRNIFPALLETRPAGEDAAFEACVRPESFAIAADLNGEGRVVDITFLGNIRRLRISWHGRELLTEAPSLASTLNPGDAVALSIGANAYTWVPA
jgi:iron(III) transport system ATP-binding protein